MTIQISQATLLVSGAVTGIAAITALSYYRHYRQSSSNDPNRSGHSRDTRRRRVRATSNELEVTLSDIDDEFESKENFSLFKEWSDDENRNLLNLLHSISLNQSRKEGFIHRGITCNKCNMSPIGGIRYKCANCVDFDLCEMCEGANTHVNTHVFLKIRIPIPPLANPRSALLPSFYSGKNQTKSTLPSEKYRELQKASHFDLVELEGIYEEFKSLSTVEGDEGGIDKETFEHCLGPLGLKKNLITERIFAFFDQDGDQIISFSEMVAGLSILRKGSLDEKIEGAFKGYDLDEDGYISRDELYRMYKSYFYLSMELVRDVVSTMEDEKMDTFEFSASQPVSAAFNVTMPSSSITDDDDEEEEITDDEIVEEEDDILEAESSTSNHYKQKSRKKRYALKEDHFLRQNIIEAEKDKINSSENLELTHTSNEKNIGLSNSPSNENQNKKSWQERFPIMETMSQGAINEMVEKTFKSIKTEKEGYINFEEFKQCVQIDPSIISWFETLGTVF